MSDKYGGGSASREMGRGRERGNRERERERERKHTLPDRDNSEPKNAMPLTAATMQFRESA